MRYLNFIDYTLLIFSFIAITMFSSLVSADDISQYNKNTAKKELLKIVDGVISSGIMPQNEIYQKIPLLHMVAEFGYTSELKKLISIGADVNIKDNFDRNALHNLVVKHGRTSIIKILIAAGIDINSQRKVSHLTPIMLPVIRGLSENVRLLLNHNANINLRSRTGDTALSYSVRNNRYDIAKMLLKNKRLSIGVYNDALDLSIKYNNPKMIELFEKNKRFKMTPLVAMKIIKNGTSYFLSGKSLFDRVDLCRTMKIRRQVKKMSLLDASIKYNRFSILKKMANNRSIYTCIDKSLLYSVEQGNYKVFELLLSVKIKGHKQKQIKASNRLLYCIAKNNNYIRIKKYLIRQINNPEKIICKE